MSASAFARADWRPRSQEELARALGLDRTMVAKIELGTRRIDAPELIRLSDVLRVPLDYLISSPPPVISRRIQLSEDTATDAGRQALRLSVALSAWVADIRQLIEWGLHGPRDQAISEPVTDTDSARVAALWVRRTVGLGNSPIESLISSAEQVGNSSPLSTFRATELHRSTIDLAVAVVSRQGDPRRRRATAAHELGHLIIGDEYSTDLGLRAPSRRSRGSDRRLRSRAI